MPGRKVLIVVSTGIDTFSRSGFPDVLRAERETGVPVCVINIGPLVRSGLLVGSSNGQQPYAHLRWQQASSQLSRMAEVSGCRAVTPDFSLEFSTLYDKWLANLNLQYVIRYQSAAFDQPGTHRVEIAWVDGDHPQLGLRQTMKRGRLFAQAQYQLAPAAGFSSAGTVNWPFLPSTAESIQVPLRAPVETELKPSMLLAAAATTTDPSGQHLVEEGCRTSPCMP